MEYLDDTLPDAPGHLPGLALFYPHRGEGFLGRLRGGLPYAAIVRDERDAEAHPVHRQRIFVHGTRPASRHRSNDDGPIVPWPQQPEQMLLSILLSSLRMARSRGVGPAACEAPGRGTVSPV